MSETTPTTSRPGAEDAPAAAFAPATANPSLPSTARIADIVETVLTGLILAFIFRAYMVEPFIIPTGSMADTLLGAHATRTCPSCGWEFDFAPLRTASRTAGSFVCPPEIICPNCRLRFAASPSDTAAKAGDRILVHKWPYALGGPFKPHRWDVIVFRDPADPGQHYIKRLVGLPGESVEIVDGDVFIDGHVARKPPDVQRQLWFIVFDQAYLRGAAPGVNDVQRWVTRDPPTDGAPGWSGLTTRIIRYDGLDETRRTMTFNPGAGREYLRDFYAYNRDSSGALVGDIRVTGELTPRAGDGLLRLELTRPPYRFAVELHVRGVATLYMESPAQSGVPIPVASENLPAFEPGRPVAIEFGHVDLRVYVRVNGREVLATSDTQYAPQLATLRIDPGFHPIGLELAAENLRCELCQLRIDRDVYYTSRAERVRNAGPGNPFQLERGEYFVLGDNSPDSHDSREWTEADTGPHLPPDYRPGTVLADQIVGQAAFVYLPGLLPLSPRGSGYLPDLGRVRFVR